MSSPSPAPALEPASAVRRAAGLLSVEAVLLGALGLLDAVATVRSDEQIDRTAAIGFAASAVLVALVVMVLSRAVLRGRGWARTPALVLQVLALPVGTDQVLGGVWLTGSAVLLIAGATGYHLLAAGPTLRPGSPSD
ncbi:MAG: hypothetical protein ABIO67_11770 [Mycobacteriales bacterium]